MDIATDPAARTAGSTAPPPSDAAATLAGDFDTFLRLLTAQIQNQDPLNPADSTAYATQLATFSNVEQAVRTNDLLTQLIGAVGGSDVAGLAGWIGSEVGGRGVTVAGDGTVSATPAIPPRADAATLVLTHPDGSEAGRAVLNPSASQGPVTARPIAADGTALPPGPYAAHVEASAGDQPLRPVPVTTYATVAEVRVTTDGPALLLSDGRVLPVAGVEGVRRPSGG